MAKTESLAAIQQDGLNNQLRGIGRAVCGTKRCSGLAIKSGGMDNPSIASR
jgi:hypothetical protein